MSQNEGALYRGGGQTILLLLLKYTVVTDNLKITRYCFKADKQSFSLHRGQIPTCYRNAHAVQGLPGTTARGEAQQIPARQIIFSRFNHQSSHAIKSLGILGDTSQFSPETTETYKSVQSRSETMDTYLYSITDPL